MMDYENVYDAYEKWLQELGLRRSSSYKSNLKSINKNLISKIVGGTDFLQKLYNCIVDGTEPNIDEFFGLLKYIVKAEQKADLYQVKLSEGTYNDCKSALNKFIWFLNAERQKKQCSLTPNNLSYPTNITWSSETRKALNADLRIKTQDRLNNDANKKVNFPIRIIDQIANNVSTWADNAALPSNHPARGLKQTVRQWLDDTINHIVILIENNKQIRLEQTDAIGIYGLESGCKHVYIRAKQSGYIYQVMTRKAEGAIEPMVLGKDEQLSSIVFDHIYRMEDILTDLYAAFPFLEELTSLIRNLNTGDIRSVATRQAVLKEIENNFSNIYASKIPQLIAELNKLGKIVSLEAIHKRDNLEKH